VWSGEYLTASYVPIGAHPHSPLSSGSHRCRTRAASTRPKRLAPSAGAPHHLPGHESERGSHADVGRAHRSTLVQVQPALQALRILEPGPLVNFHDGVNMSKIHQIQKPLMAAVLNSIVERRFGSLRAFLLVFCACLGAMAPPATGQCRGKPASRLLPPSLKLTIRTEKPYAETARPLTIFIELTNASSGPVWRYDTFVERDYELYVKDDRGKEAPLTERAKKLRIGPIGGSSYHVDLAPGETHKAEEDLSKVYAITVPGKYTIEACRVIEGWGNVYSNKIEVTFIAPPVE